MWLSTFDGGYCDPGWWQSVVHGQGVSVKFVPGFFNFISPPNQAFQTSELKQLQPAINGDFIVRLFRLIDSEY